MYAYCANNPVMCIDPSGESGLLALLASIGPVGWAAIGVLGVLAVIAVCYYQDEILSFVDAAIETVASPVEKTLEKKYTVYTLVDDAGAIRYVGRVLTKNYSARMDYHRTHKPGLSPGAKIDNLNYWECRGLEQLGIIAYSTGWFDESTNPHGNKINGIGIRNQNRFDYYGAAIRYVWNNVENEWTNLFH